MKQQAFHTNPIFRMVWPMFYGAVIYLLILLLNNNLSQLDESFFGQELYFCIALSYLVFESNRFILLIDAKRKTDDQSAFRIISVIAINLLLTTLIVFVVVKIYFNAILGFSAVSSFSTELSMFILIYAATGLIYSSLVISNQFLFKENQNLMKNERMLAENLELELLKFRNEVNPDLLYDSLESLISLIHKDLNEAEDYIDRLALVYRHILSNKNNELIGISREMQAADNIVYLLNEKHNHYIKIHSLPDEVPDFLVIPGAVINAIEAIVRQTIITDIQPLEIYFDIQEDSYLVIRHKMNNRLVDKNQDYISELQNAYSIYTEKPVISVKAYGENYVKIPILQLEEEITLR